MSDYDEKWMKRVCAVFFGCLIVGVIITWLFGVLVPTGFELVKGMITPLLMIVGLLYSLYKYTRDKYDH